MGRRHGEALDLLNNNGAKPVPAGGLLYATVKSEVGHTVTLSTTGQFAVDVSQAPTFNPGPTATFPSTGGNMRWLFTPTSEIAANSYASLIFTPGVTTNWIVQLTSVVQDCPLIEACFSSLGLQGMSPGNYCTFMVGS